VSDPRRARPLRLPALLAALALCACAWIGASAAAGANATLSLIAYSTPQEAYGKIIPAFERTPAGRGVDFQQSYGSSGEQSRAVQSGLPADVVAFSLEPDITRLVDDGLVAKTWNRGPTHGIVTDSVVVLAVRPGNPKKIRGWNDLLKPGLQIVVPNPSTSGGARWNVMAAYGAQRKLGKTDAQALDYVKALLKKVVVFDKSARESLQTFLGGKGDVLIAYENEAIAARTTGSKLDYVVPAQTILIENPVAVVSSSSHKTEANAFIRYLTSPAAQKIFGQNGYRPVLKPVLAKFRFPQPPQLFTIASLGGWAKVSARFFDKTNGLVAKMLGG
jgi:sulfate/thiosulfate transport system substrate-binding protein